MHRPGTVKSIPKRESEPRTLAGSDKGRMALGTFARVWRRRNWLLAALDVAACLVSFLGCYYLRFHVDYVTALIPLTFPSTPAVDPYIKATILTTALWILLMKRERMYRDELHFATSLGFRVRIVLITGFYSMVFLMVISFMFRYLLLSRIVYVGGFVSACTLMILVRICFRFVDRRLDDQCVTMYRVLLMGWNRNVEALLDRLQKHNRCTHVLGRLGWGLKSDRIIGNGDQIPYLGTAKDLEDIYREAPFDQLIVVPEGRGTDPQVAAQRETMVRVLNFCEEHGISFYMVPDFVDVIVSRRELGSFSGIPLMRLMDASLHPVYAWVKRAMDVVVASVVLVAGSPLWLAIAVLIKVTSKGPVFYVQKRAGMYGNQFDMYKFRSMVEDAEEKLKGMIDFKKLKEPVFKFRNDPRVTGFGRILRRFGLDEIPQLFNVLLGQMSIVGPRPEQVELVKRYDPWQRRRLKARPGITGYQQVVCRGDLSLAKRIEYDLYYLKHQSFFLDVLIMLRTVLVVIRGDGMK
ncbi:MAG: sugar transferase [Desulfomonilaceae bacterium]|nr:sugar transferase [Desulfomonilaceae bacterium]